MLIISGTLVLMFVLAILFSAFVFVATATHKLPDFRSEKLWSRAQTTKVYDNNDNLITDFYVEQNRIVVPLNKISKNMQNAVIAIEDQRFYDHEGVDWKAIGRALIADIKQGRIVQGGSTLTQQLVKNTLVDTEQTVQRKIREAVLAYQIESKYSKKEILQSYLNTIYFGHSAYGVETAAQTFFGKASKDLTIAESSLLAGVIRSPNAFSPYADPTSAKRRRDMVIAMMSKQKLITVAQTNEALDAPIQLRPLEKGDYPYPYFVEHVKQLMLTDSNFGSTVSERANNLFQGGLRIYTTIDPDMQTIAEDAVWSTLDLPGDPSGSIVAIEPSTGYIRAMVGGRDWQTQKFNLATQAKRQPGSAFKPFVLASAIEQGISISKPYSAGTAVIRLPGKNWVVDGGGGGMIALREATIRSVNAVYARLIMDVGPSKVVALVKKMGIESRVEALPAIALGGLGGGVTPLDMATAYTTFANNGQHARPIAIRKVTDSNGRIIEENKITMDPAMDPATAYLVTDTLKGVISSGTGRRANIGRPAAGKTGTTDSNGDAWFVGYTPDLAASVWVGYTDSRRPMTNVHGITVQGGTFPAQIWQSFMSRALAGTPAKDFTRPEKGVARIYVCTDRPHMRATDFCPEPFLATYAEGTGPVLPCDLHTTPPAVAMANLIGMPAEDAKNLLEQAGLLVSITETDTLDVPLGYVANQDPVEGVEVEVGSQVRIEISSGNAPLTEIMVPNILGMPLKKAKSILADAGLTATVVYVAVGDPSDVGKVVGQIPRARKKIFPTTEVILRVGRKP